MHDRHRLVILPIGVVVAAILEVVARPREYRQSAFSDGRVLCSMHDRFCIPNLVDLRHLHALRTDIQRAQYQPLIVVANPDNRRDSNSLCRDHQVRRRLLRYRTMLGVDDAEVHP